MTSRDRNQQKTTPTRACNDGDKAQNGTKTLGHRTPEQSIHKSCLWRPQSKHCDWCDRVPFSQISPIYIAKLTNTAYYEDPLPFQLVFHALCAYGQQTQNIAIKTFFYELSEIFSKVALYSNARVSAGFSNYKIFSLCNKYYLECRILSKIWQVSPSSRNMDIFTCTKKITEHTKMETKIALFCP